MIIVFIGYFLISIIIALAIFAWFLKSRDIDFEEKIKTVKPGMLKDWYQRELREKKR